MSLATAPSIGHNQPPTVAEQIQASLAENHAALIKRRDDLLGSAERAPAVIDSDETAGRVTDLIRLIGAATKASETARVSEKEPHLEAGRAVDGWFKKISDPLAKAKAKVQGPLDTYLRQKEAAERQRREAEAKALREAAEREAAAMQTEAQMNAAVAIEERAAEAQEAAQAKPAELARTRGDYGGLATLRTTWDFEIVNAAAVPREYLIVNDAAIRAAVKSGAREIAGVRIFEKQSALVR